MKEVVAALLIISWFSVGIGVTIGYAARHDKEVPEDGALLVSAVLWPALITADVYRALNPKPDFRGMSE